MKQPRRARTAILGLLALAAAALGVRYQTAPDPGYAATAILTGGRDVNLVVRDGKGIVVPVEYDREGHGRLAKGTSDWLKGTVGVAPVLGWDLPYIQEIARGQRGIRYCAAEMRDYPETLAQSIRAVEDTFSTLPGARPAIQDCARFDLQFGVTPETDCGSPMALGCAAHRGHYVRVTVRPDLPLEAQYWVMVHESLHALNLGHTGHYGQEGRNHPHVSCLGFLDIGVGGNNRPVDNPQGLPCTPDLEDGTGGYRWGFRSTPTPTPTPSPTPAPSPPAAAMAQVWLYRHEGARACTVGGDADWVVVTCAAGTPARFWHRWLDGDFQEVRHD